MTDDELKALIELAKQGEERVWNLWTDYVNGMTPTKVRVVAEELLDLRRHKAWTSKVINDMKEEVLAARKLRDSFRISTEDDPFDYIDTELTITYDTARKKNQTIPYNINKLLKSKGSTHG